MFINIASLRIRYECAGEGKPIVLLHGWGTHLGSLYPLMKHISTYRKVYALDLPGFGKSDFPPNGWAVSDYADLVLDFMAKCKIEKPDMLGHSFGGRITIKIAALYPQQAASVILVDSAGVRQYETGWKYKLTSLLAKLGKPVTDRLPNFLRKNVRRRFYQAIGSSDYLNAGRLKETYTKVIAEDLESLLPSISAQTLLIWGEKDDATPLADGRLMANKIPNSKLVVLPNAGHYSFLDQTALTTQTLDNFLRH